jgi:Ion channel
VAADTDEQSARLRPMLARRGDRYGLLLLLLVFSYVISAFSSAGSVALAGSLLFVVTLLLALRTSGVHRRTVRLIMGIVVAGTATTAAFAFTSGTDTGFGVASIWTALVLLLTVGVILRRVLSMPIVSLQSIFGAVSAYMLIGFMYASIYAAMDRLESAPFFANGQPANSRTFQYFSFVTLTTTGYGDFTAATNLGRAVAVMEAIGGQVFLATLVARLVASYRSPRRTAVALGDTEPIGDTGPSAGNAETAPAPGPAAVAGQSWNGRTRRGNSNRPRAGRAPPVKWRRARHR